MDIRDRVERMNARLREYLATSTPGCKHQGLNGELLELQTDDVATYVAAAVPRSGVGLMKLEEVRLFVKYLAATEWERNEYGSSANEETLSLRSTLRDLGDHWSISGAVAAIAARAAKRNDPAIQMARIACMNGRGDKAIDKLMTVLSLVGGFVVTPNAHASSPPDRAEPEYGENGLFQHRRIRDSRPLHLIDDQGAHAQIHGLRVYNGFGHRVIESGKDIVARFESRAAERGYKTSTYDREFGWVAMASPKSKPGKRRPYSKFTSRLYLQEGREYAAEVISSLPRAEYLQQILHTSAIPIEYTDATRADSVLVPPLQSRKLSLEVLVPPTFVHLAGDGTIHLVDQHGIPKRFTVREGLLAPLKELVTHGVLTLDDLDGATSTTRFSSTTEKRKPGRASTLRQRNDRCSTCISSLRQCGLPVDRKANLVAIDAQITRTDGSWLVELVRPPRRPPRPSATSVVFDSRHDSTRRIVQSIAPPDTGTRVAP